MQSIGPYIATAIAATVGDPRNFASGRHFAAWLGLTPKQHSTDGKEKLGGISKRGDSYIRRLLIHGARATVARVRSGQIKSAWLSGLLSRQHFNVATVALANKTARVAWAVMSTEQAFAKARVAALGNEDAPERLAADYGLWVGSFVRGELAAMRVAASNFCANRRFCSLTGSYELRSPRPRRAPAMSSAQLRLSTKRLRLWIVRAVAHLKRSCIASVAKCS